MQELRNLSISMHTKTVDLTDFDGLKEVRGLAN